MLPDFRKKVCARAHAKAYTGYSYFDIPSDGCGTFMTTAEISDKLVIKGSIKKPMSLVKLGMLLKKSGFQSKQFGSSRARGWLVRERNTDEVNANRNIEGRTP